MKTSNICIKNPIGIHARPAGKIVEQAMKYQSTVEVTVKDKKVNCKSIIALLSAGISFNDTVVIHVEGTDEDVAIKSISELFEATEG